MIHQNGKHTNTNFIGQFQPQFQSHTHTTVESNHTLHLLTRRCEKFNHHRASLIRNAIEICESKSNKLQVCEPHNVTLANLQDLKNQKIGSRNYGISNRKHR